MHRIAWLHWQNQMDIRQGQNVCWRMQQKKQSVSAQKKLEQNIMNLMPLGILAYLKISSGDFLSAIYGNAFGVCFMSICLGIYVGALILAEKILKIEA